MKREAEANRTCPRGHGHQSQQIAEDGHTDTKHDETAAGQSGNTYRNCIN